MKETIRICIGTEPKTRIPECVLMHSITTRTDHPIEFVSMIGKDWEIPSGLHQGTGFSLRRWLIPSFFNFSGRVIYLDADQIVLADIAELWLKPITQPEITSVWLTYQPDKTKPKPWPQTSVMVIDCAAATQWQPKVLWELLRNNKIEYQKFMHGRWLDHPPARIGNEWNALNVFETGKTKLLHYTVEPEQPWYNPKHQLSKLWQIELENAIKANTIAKNEFEEALNRWGKKEDWRPTNGLHPFYKQFLGLFK